jgi:hypothetical protein
VRPSLPSFADPTGQWLDHDAVQLAIDRSLGFAPPANEATLSRVVSELRGGVPRGVLMLLTEGLT